MIEELQEKIGIIRNHYAGNKTKGLTQDAEQKLKNIENKIDEVNLKSEMADNPLIDKLKIQLKAKVVDIDEQLRNQTVHTKDEIIYREILFAKQSWYRDELAMFIDSEEIFKKINEQLDSWIKKLK